MPVLPIIDFKGGWSRLEPDEIKDNQFERVKNYFYNKNRQLQTRYGFKQYFENVPDSVVLINACDATTGFAVSDDAVTLALGAAIRGNNSVSFNITVATSGTNQATLTHTSLVANITNYKGYFGMHIKVPVGFNTDLTNVKVRFGSNSSNYYEWTLPSLTENQATFLKFPYSEATVVGSPVDATMTYFRLQVTYAGTYTNKTGVLIDSIYSYSSLNNKPVTSYFFFQRDDNLLRTAICMSGPNTYRWDETASAWEVIDTGLTEFETKFAINLQITGNVTSGSKTISSITDTSQLTIGMTISGNGIPNGATIATIPTANSITISVDATATGTGVTLTVFGNPSVTDNRTRWSFAVYKNNIYMCNGADDYRMWNGTKITTYPGQPRIRYIYYMKDRLFGFGDDDNPSSLYYTNALPVDGSALNTNTLVVGGDELGIGNGLFELGSFILAFKSKKIYTINVTGSSAEGLDTQNGGFSHRAIANVGNALLYYNDQGIDNLKQKAAAVGNQALESAPYTDDLRSLMGKIAPRQYNANCGIYIKSFNNYYFTFDTGDDNSPETTIVYSSLIGRTWTEYTYPAIYHYGFYIDASGRYHYLATSANVGIIYEIETGFNDDGGLIEYDLLTKSWDFGDETAWKDFHSVTISGLKSEGTVMHIEILVDREIVYTGDLTDDFIVSTTPVVTIGSDPIGTQPLAGGAPGDELVDLYRYKVRLGGELFAAGYNIQVHMYNTEGPAVMTLNKIRVRYDANTEDVFLADNTI